MFLVASRIRRSYDYELLLSFVLFAILCCPLVFGIDNLRLNPQLDHESDSQ